MSYAIMARDECGDETLCFDKHYTTYEEADANFDRAIQRYPEWRNFFIEEVRDKAYYQRQQLNQERDWWDDYND